MGLDEIKFRILITEQLRSRVLCCLGVPPQTGQLPQQINLPNYKENEQNKFLGTLKMHK